ncbi:hypothetical protein ABLE68_21650 [Nocardioides sp. CN2-186]|uniref:hypothetical protein n=1 Tax=Nocardioides tweenelious TaxID=3156607 RepID=UPI0032B5237A
MAVVAAGLTAVSMEPAAADVKGDLRMVGEQPVSGTYDFAYNNYSEKITPCVGAHCYFKGYRVSNGTLHVKLHTYKLVERIRDYDYYVLDVDVDNGSRGGASHNGWAQVFVENAANARGRAVRMVDYSDTKSISANSPDCTSLSLAMGHAVGPVSASVSWGSVEFCDKAASYDIDRHEGANRTVFMAHDARNVARFSTQRIVKVPRGAKPSFKVTVHIPRDVCTSADDNICNKYRNATATWSHVINTTG